MTNRDNTNGGDFPFPGPHPAFEDVAALLDLLDTPPADAAEEQVICAFRRRLAGGPATGTAAPRPRGRCRPLPDQRFRPNLEDLGPRELSSFPAFGAVAGPAHLAFLSTSSVAEAAPRPLVLSAAQPTAVEQHLTATGSAGAREVDTQVLDRYFSSCPSHELSSSWAVTAEHRPFDFAGLVPGVGAVLLLGGLRQDQDHYQPPPRVASRPAAGRPRRRPAAQLVA